MRTSHKLTRLVLALMSLMALATSLFAQGTFNSGAALVPIPRQRVMLRYPSWRYSLSGTEFPRSAASGFPWQLEQ